MLHNAGKILWNNKMYKTAIFQEYTNMKNKIGHNNLYNVASMVRSCVGPFECNKRMIFTGKAIEFDENLAYLLGVMQWHNDNYLFNSERSNKENADTFLNFIKYYMVNIMNDCDGFMFDRIVLIITKGLYSRVSEAGHNAAVDYYCNENRFVGGMF